MRLIPRESIIVSNRQRTDLDPKALGDLRSSIEARGLLHPPVVARNPLGGYNLVAGERRLRVIDLIAEGSGVFQCNLTVVSPGEVPVTFVEDLSPSDLFALEFEENELREPLSWQDRMKA